MKNLAIITARSGSKGLVDKNIREICGKPMLAYTIEAAKESKCFDTIMVSTDSIQYADISIEYGAEVPFLRSNKTSSDTSGSWEVVDEVINKYLEEDCIFDTVCLLQPTSPLRESRDIIEGYNLLKEKKADAITSVCEAEHSTGVYLHLPEDKSMCTYRNTKGFYLPRQIDEKLYRINGALYIRRVKYDEGKCYTIFQNEYAYIMDKSRSLDIDDEYDSMLAEVILSARTRKNES